MASLQRDMGCLYLAVCDKPRVDCSLKTKSTTPPLIEYRFLDSPVTLTSKTRFLRFGFAVPGNRYSRQRAEYGFPNTEQKGGDKVGFMDLIYTSYYIHCTGWAKKWTDFEC